MRSLLDWFVRTLGAPFQWEWQAGDRVAAAALLGSVIAASWALIARRSDRKAARLASAPDVVATFSRTPARPSIPGRVRIAERVVATLENIGSTPAYDVSYACVPWSDESMSPARVTPHDAHIAHISPREKHELSGHRAIQLEWDEANRTWEDLPFAIFEFSIAFSDRTHRYDNTYCVSLFGYPDQITEHAENEISMQTTRQRSVPLGRGSMVARLSSLWELGARPLRRRRYQRLMKQQLNAANEHAEGPTSP